MALIRCQVCSTEVSDRAANCVKCGAPLAGKAASPIGNSGYFPQQPHLPKTAPLPPAKHYSAEPDLDEFEAPPSFWKEHKWKVIFGTNWIFFIIFFVILLNPDSDAPGILIFLFLVNFLSWIISGSIVAFNFFKGRCTCKYCGLKTHSINSLLQSGTCSRSPTGYHEPFSGGHL